MPMLEEKTQSIDMSAEQSQQQLATKFGIGKTQFILKRKDELLEAYKSNGNKHRKCLCNYRTDLDNVDEVTWQWLERVHAKNMPVSGPMIQGQAKEVATHLQKPDFKGYILDLTRCHLHASFQKQDHLGSTLHVCLSKINL